MPRNIRRDGGFAVVLMSLIMITMLGAVTVAVDLGSRYAEAAKIQRAADAAALAGVTVLPNGLSIAETEARQVAARNGYAHGVDGITVDVDQVDDEVVQVRIEDPSVPQYFASLFDGGTSITRVATAKYVRAVALGSPRNFLGTGNLLGSDNGGDMRRLRGRDQDDTEDLRENYWLAISGECSSKENGDRFNTISDANYDNTQNPRRLDDGGGWAHCEGGNTVPNHEFRDYGYVYAVTVPSGYDDGQLAIDVFDPALCENSRPGDPGNADSYGMDTTFTIRTGSADPLGGTVIDHETFSPRDSGCSNWTTLHTVVPPEDGATYYVQVDAGRNHHDSGTMSNGFALRADVTGNSSGSRFWGCSSDPVDEDLYDDECPQVYSVGDMGVFASLTGSQAEFFLAEIGPEYNGKTLEITLFDPGEGAEALRIKDPDGAYASFDWEVECGASVTEPTGGCSGTDDDVLHLIGETSPSCPRGYDVDTDGNGHADECVNNPQPGPRRLSRWKYSDRSITLSVDLPDDIADEYGGATWWKVEYTTNTAPTDRTTWSAKVLGDPVRLIPNP